MDVCASDRCVKSNLCAENQQLSPVRLHVSQLLTEYAQAAELLVTWHTVDSYAEHYGIRLGDGLRSMWIIRPGDWYCGVIILIKGSMVTAVLNFLIQNI